MNFQLFGANVLIREAVTALVGVGKEASAWLVQNLNGNIPQGMSTPVTIQMMPESQCRGCPFLSEGLGCKIWLTST